MWIVSTVILCVVVIFQQIVFNKAEKQLKEYQKKEVENLNTLLNNHDYDETDV